MSLSQEALEHIQKNAVALEVQGILEDGVVIVPQGYILQSTEQFLPEPKSFRGNYSTNNLPDFIEYLVGNKTNATAIFIGDDKVVGVIDCGDAESPQWGKHTATLSLKKTPEYAAMLEAIRRKHNQKDFIDFVQDHGHVIMFADDEDVEISFVEGLRGLRKLSVSSLTNKSQQLTDFSTSMSLDSATTVKNGSEKSVAAALLKTSGYNDLDEKIIKCPLRYSVEGQDIVIGIRIMQAAQFEQQLANEIAEKIKEGLPDVRCYKGAMQR